MKFKGFKEDSTRCLLFLGINSVITLLNFPFNILELHTTNITSDSLDILEGTDVFKLQPILPLVHRFYSFTHIKLDEIYTKHLKVKIFNNN